MAPNALVPWGDFRGRLDAVWRCPSADRKSRAGRNPWNTVVMLELTEFKDGIKQLQAAA